jgi:hypothetical protein
VPNWVVGSVEGWGGEESTCDDGRQKGLGIRLVVRRTTPRVRGCESSVAWQWRIQGGEYYSSRVSHHWLRITLR